MKNSCWMILIAVAVLLNACSGPAKKPSNRFGSGGRVPSNLERQDTQFVGGGVSSPSPSLSTPSQPEQASAVPTVDRLSATTETAVETVKTISGSQGEIPYAVPVPGKPGLVTSPHAPNSGYVDIRGYPPGQEVKCPYTGKLFRVP